MPGKAREAVRFTSRRPDAGRRNPYVDAGWWPRSGELANELEQLVHAAVQVGVCVSRVTYRLDDGWTVPVRTVLVDGREIKLSGYHNHRRNMIRLIDGAAHKQLEVMVVPPDTKPVVAELALRLAAAHTDPSHGTDILRLAREISPAVR